jgi:hypothetical protein
MVLISGRWQWRAQEWLQSPQVLQGTKPLWNNKGVTFLLREAGQKEAAFHFAGQLETSFFLCPYGARAGQVIGKQISKIRRAKFCGLRKKMEKFAVVVLLASHALNVSAFLISTPLLNRNLGGEILMLSI